MIILQVQPVIVFACARMIAAVDRAIKLGLHVNRLDVSKEYATIAQIEITELTREDIRAEIEIVVELGGLRAGDFAAGK